MLKNDQDIKIIVFENDCKKGKNINNKGPSEVKGPGCCTTNQRRHTVHSTEQYTINALFPDGDPQEACERFIKANEAGI